MHAVTLDLALLFAVSHKVRELAPPTVRGEAEIDDGEYVRRALGGDPWAEEALYRRHVRAVGNVVARLIGRSHEAEDVVQEAFLSAFRDLHELRQADSFRSWLLCIAVRIVHRHFRRRRVRRALGVDREQDDRTLLSEVDPAADPETRAEIGKIDEILRTLSPNDRIAWILRNVEGYKVDEVAKLCRCSRATAKRRVARAEATIGAHVSVYPQEDD